MNSFPMFIRMLLGAHASGNQRRRLRRAILSYRSTDSFALKFRLHRSNKPLQTLAAIILNRGQKFEFLVVRWVIRDQPSLYRQGTIEDL